MLPDLSTTTTADGVVRVVVRFTVPHTPLSGALPSGVPLSVDPTQRPSFVQVCPEEQGIDAEQSAVHWLVVASQ